MGLGRWVGMLASFCDKVHLCVPVRSGARPPGLARFDIPNVVVCALPIYFRAMEAEAVRHPVRLIRALWSPIARSDVVFIMLFNYMGLYVWALSLLAGKPIISNMAGDTPQLLCWAFQRRGIPLVGPVVRAIHALLYHGIIRSSAVVLCVGQEIARKYAPGNPRALPYVNSRVRADEVADKVAGGLPVRRLLAVGRLDFYKGLRELLRAASDLVNEGLNLRVRLAGEGNDRGPLEKMAEDLGIADRVDFLGHVRLNPELKAEYRAADVFVLPSHSEGLPKVVLEAMANGAPVVATHVGSVPLMVEDGQTGFIVPPRDADALRDAVRRLLLDEGLRVRFARAGQHKVRGFTMEALRERFVAAFRRFGLLGSSASEDGPGRRAGLLMPRRRTCAVRPLSGPGVLSADGGTL